MVDRERARNSNEEFPIKIFEVYDRSNRSGLSVNDRGLRQLSSMTNDVSGTSRVPCGKVNYDDASDDVI